MYLKCRAHDMNLQDFTNNFSTYDRVNNDHEVGQMIKELITNQDEKGWEKCVVALIFKLVNHHMIK